MAALDEELVPYFNALRDFAAQRGIRLSLTSGYRTIARQTALRKTLGADRAAAPGNSYHNYGLAFDVALSPSTDEAWELVGQYAEALGFRWGKRFRKPERWHFDVGRGIGISRARQLYGQGQYLREVV